METLEVPATDDIISISDSENEGSSGKSSNGMSKRDLSDDRITISSVETIDSAADFTFEYCYFVFKHLKKVIGWSSPFLKWQEIVVVVSVFFSIVTATYLLAFQRDAPETFRLFYACDIVYGTNLLFMVFIALSPPSAWSTPSQLSYRSKCRRRSLIDLLATVPIEFFVWKFMNRSYSSQLSDCMALARLNRLLRAYRLFGFFHRQKNQIGPGSQFTDLLAALCALLLLIHISACYWYAMNCIPFFGKFDTRILCWLSNSANLYSQYPVNRTINPFQYQSDEAISLSSWTVNFLSVDYTLNMDFVGTMYSVCVYWATYTAFGVGYGEYIGMRYLEVVFSVCVMLIGAAITNGMVIGNLTSLLTNVESHRAEFSHRLKMVKRYLRDNDYADDIVQSIQGFYEYIWFKKKGQTDENMYGTLPLSLQSEIYLSVNRCALNKSPMFQNLDEGFLRSIALKIQSQFFLPGQMVINKGEVCRSMYYVLHGQLEILSSSDDFTPVAMLRPGKLLGEVNLILNYSRTASIRAATHCDLLVLHQSDLSPVLEHYPQAQMKMWEYVRDLFKTDFQIDDDGYDEDGETTTKEATQGGDGVTKGSSNRLVRFSSSLSPMPEEDTASVTANKSKEELSTENQDKEAQSEKPEEQLQKPEIQEPEVSDKESKPKEPTLRLPVIPGVAKTPAETDAPTSTSTEPKPVPTSPSPSSTGSEPPPRSPTPPSTGPESKSALTPPVPAQPEIKKSLGFLKPTQGRSGILFKEVPSKMFNPKPSAEKIPKASKTLPSKPTTGSGDSNISLILDDERKPIAAFRRPGKMDTEFTSGSLRQRRFTWSRKMSVYKQVRRPNMYQHEQTEHQLAAEVVVLQEDSDRHTSIGSLIINKTKRPPLISNGTFETCWACVLWAVVMLQWYMYLYYASFVDGYPLYVLELTYILDAMHVIDVIMCLITTQITPRKVYGTYKEIWRYQFRRVGFYLNVLAAVPLDVLALPFTARLKTGTRNKVTTLLKLNKLMRAWVIPDRIKYFEDQLYVSLSLIRPLEVIIYIFMGTHFCACLWFLDAKMRELWTGVEAKDNWFEIFTSKHASNSSLRRVHPYTLSLYWAAATMSTTGFGDIIAMSIPEYVISIFVMFLGLFLFAYTLASHAALLTNMEKPKVQFQSIVFAMQRFMLDNRLDRVLRKRVMRYMEIQWRSYEGRIMAGRSTPMYDLPEALQQDLASDGIVKILYNVPLFHGTDIAFRQELARRCSRHLFPPNEYVLYSGDLGRDMYVIVRGYCESFLGNQQKSLGLMGPGSRFGEAGMLYGLPRPAHVVTRTHCDLLVIPHGEFQRILKDFPTISQQIKEAQEDPKVLLNVKRKHARVWHMSKELGKVEAPTHIIEKPPSFVDYAKEKPEEYMKPFEELGRWKFLRRLLLRSTIRPDGQFAIQLECFRMMVATLIMLTTPVQIALLSSNLHVYIMCSCLDALCLLYMYLRLHSAYYNEWSCMVTHPVETAKHYLSTAFVFDLVSSLPVDLIVIMAYGKNAYDSLDTIVLYRLNRLFQLYHIMLGFTHWERESLFRGGRIKTLKYVLYLILYLHFVSCFWAFLSCHKVDSGSNGDGHLRHVNNNILVDNQLIKPICEGESWFSASSFKNITGPGELYLVSTLFGLELISSVGFGDITPQTNVEIIFSIIMMIHGVIFFGYIIASVTASLVNADISRATFNNRVKRLGKQMKYELVPHDLQQSVLRHVEYEFYRSQGMQAHGLFTNLPPSIRGDVSIVLFEKLISSVPIFSTIDRSFHRMLSMCLKEAFFLENELVIHRGDIGKQMYFIHRGVCDVVMEDGTSTVSLGPGRFFGEVSVMFSIPRTVTVRAQTNADLFVLTRTDLHDVLENYPDIKREIERIAMERLQETQKKETTLRSDTQSISSEIGVMRSSKARTPMASLLTGHHGKKHKVNRRRSLMVQLADAVHLIPNPITTLRPKPKPEKTDETVLIEETKNAPKIVIKSSMILSSIAQQLQTVTKSIRSSIAIAPLAKEPNVSGLAVTDGKSSLPDDSSVKDTSEPANSKTSLKKGSSATQGRPSEAKTSQSHASEPSIPARETSTLTAASIQSEAREGKEAPKSKTNSNSDLESKHSETNKIKEVPSIQLTPDTETDSPPVLEKTAEEATSPTSKTSNLSLKASREGGSKSSGVREVYMSNQKINVESETAMPPINPDDLEGPGWVPHSQRSSLASFRVELPQTSYTRRAPFRAPPAVIRYSGLVYNLLTRIIPSNFVFSPEANILLFFNLILSSLGLFEFILMFYQIAFYEDIFFGISMDLVFANGCIFYSLNIFVRMHTAYYDKHRDLVRDWLEVRRVYMHRPTGFLVDLLSALPIDLLGYIGGDSMTLQHAMSMLRLVHLARAYTIYEFFYSCERRLNAPILLLRCLRDLLVLMLMLHTLACLWFVVACPSNQCTAETWVAHRSLMQASQVERYVNSLYYTAAVMTSTGFGDIVPVSLREIAYTILVIIIGKFSFGFIIGDLASTLSNLETARVEMETRLDVIINQMKDQQVPKSLQKRVVQHVKYDWLRNRGHGLGDLLEHIPYCLRVEVFDSIYGDQLRSSSIFRDAPDFMIRRLSCMCEQKVFLPGDFIAQRGDIGKKMYVIRRGSVMVYEFDRNNPEYFLYTGAMYGEIQMVYPTLPYTHSLVAEYPSDILVINQSEIQQLLADNPHFFFKVRRYIQERYASIIQGRRPTMLPSKML